MLREDLIKLRRHSLLALKGFFSVSLSKGWEDLLDNRQIAAAHFMHQAACRELEMPDAEPLSAGVLVKLQLIKEELMEAIASDNFNEKAVVEAINLVDELLGEHKPADVGGGTQTEGAPTA